MPLKYIRYLLQVMMVYQQQWEKHASKYGEGTVFYGSVKCLFDSMFGEEYERDEMQKEAKAGRDQVSNHWIVYASKNCVCSIHLLLL